MAILRVGKIELIYEVRRSSRARARRIIVTPDGIEVVAPAADDDESIATFMKQRRRWVYDRWEEMQEKSDPTNDPWPRRIATGATMLFRGRRMRLTVTRSSSDTITIRYRGGFHISRPDRANESDVRTALEEWLRQRMYSDAIALTRHHARLLELPSPPVHVRELKNHWGICGRKGEIVLDWRLVMAPRYILEYAVVHELCHLIERNHSPAFWSLLAAALPGYEERKSWLRRHERRLLG